MSESHWIWLRKPVNMLEVTMGGHELKVFICHTNPISEIDLFIQDAKNEGPGAITHANQPYFGLYHEVRLPSGQLLELSIGCSKK